MLKTFWCVVLVVVGSMMICCTSEEIPNNTKENVMPPSKHRPSAQQQAGEKSATEIEIASDGKKDDPKQDPKPDTTQEPPTKQETTTDTNTEQAQAQVNTGNDAPKQDTIEKKPENQFGGLAGVAKAVMDQLGAHGENLENIKDEFDPYKGEHEFDGEFDDENIPLDKYDFDPSEGLSFVVETGRKECFYEEIKTDEDHVSGAYIVMAADPKIDMVIKDPNGQLAVREYGKEESDYEILDVQLGVYEICFDNGPYSEDKLITHVTHTLQSQHPAEKEHVSHLAQYASHLDVKLGELESEQNLLQLRTNRHIKTEQSTNQRVAFYSTIECIIYISVSILQVVYIKHLLDHPRSLRAWA